MFHLSGSLLQTCLCRSYLVIVSMRRSRVVDLAIVVADFKYGQNLLYVDADNLKKFKDDICAAEIQECKS